MFTFWVPHVLWVLKNMPKGWRTYLTSSITLPYRVFFLTEPLSCCFGESLRCGYPAPFKRFFGFLNQEREDVMKIVSFGGWVGCEKVDDYKQPWFIEHLLCAWTIPGLCNSVSPLFCEVGGVFIFVYKETGLERLTSPKSQMEFKSSSF